MRTASGTVRRERTDLAMATGCSGCRDGQGIDFAIAMAFHPIVDVEEGAIFAYEALVRGGAGESAGSVLARVDAKNRYAFDQACRVKAIETAAALRLDARVSINFLPNAVYQPEACLRTTIAAASRVGLPLDSIIMEVTEGEKIEDVGHVAGIFAHYRARGLLTAIDDFGAGYSGLNLLAALRPDIVKIDMALVQGIDADRTRQVILRGIVEVCRGLGIVLVAEGIERIEEEAVLRGMGVRFLQGFLYARPAVGAMPPVDLARLRRPGAAA